MPPNEEPIDIKYCAQCPAHYRVDQILGKRYGDDGAEESRPWPEVYVRPKSPSKLRIRDMIRRNGSTEVASVGGQSMKERADIVAQGWQPWCPEGHRLPPTLYPSFVVGVVGNVNSSKSHYLAGTVLELITRRELKPFGVDISYLGDPSDSIMKERIEAVYARGEVLPNTEREQIDGPFSYRMTFGEVTAESSRELSFFDVAGEDCTSLQRSAAFVRYLYKAAGIVVLLDPDGIPSPGHPFQSKGGAKLVDREIIDTLANGIEQVTGIDPRSRSDLAIVIAVSKADSVDWVDSEWPVSISDLPREGRAARLRAMSEASRTELLRLGGGGIVDAAEARFNKSQVFYTRVSATNQAPIGGGWQDPEPVGCSVPLAMILLSQGLVH